VEKIVEKFKKPGPNSGSAGETFERIRLKSAASSRFYVPRNLDLTGDCRRTGQILGRFPR
jgi:hypothetical protein